MQKTDRAPYLILSQAHRILRDQYGLPHSYYTFYRHGREGKYPVHRPERRPLVLLDELLEAYGLKAGGRN